MANRGTRNVGKAKPEESLAAKSGVQGCGFDPLRGRLAFSVFHLATMFVVCTYAYSVLVVSVLLVLVFSLQKYLPGANI